MNLLQDRFIFKRPLARWPASPRVIAARAHPEQFAHFHDSVVFLVEVDEGEDVRFRAEVNAMAFFKMSCSSCRRA